MKPSHCPRPLITLAAVFLAAGLAYSDRAPAGEITTIVGPVTKIELAADGKSAQAIVKNLKSGEDVPVTVTDDLTLGKFKDKRIVEGDEIRVRYEKKDGGNASRTFKKTAGC